MTPSSASYGDIDGTTVFQAKGFPYDLADLIPDQALRTAYRNGKYITLRLKSSMYHRFHAPLDCQIREVTYISGDTWNVNPIALQRIEKLYCKNERAVIELDTGLAHSRICLVPVAAILVASIRLHWLDDLLCMDYRGPRRIPLRRAVQQGRRTGLLPARLHDHSVGHTEFLLLRGYPHRCAHPHGASPAVIRHSRDE